MRQRNTYDGVFVAPVFIECEVQRGANDEARDLITHRVSVINSMRISYDVRLFHKGKNATKTLDADDRSEWSHEFSSISIIRKTEVSKLSCLDGDCEAVIHTHKVQLKKRSWKSWETKQVNPVLELII